MARDSLATLSPTEMARRASPRAGSFAQAGIRPVLACAILCRAPALETRRLQFTLRPHGHLVILRWGYEDKT